jgi:hypothetical protein
MLDGFDHTDRLVSDNVAERVLPVGMDVTGGPAAMTIELCLNACQAQSYTFAGLEYSDECYCGNTVPPTLATDGRCNMVCDGNNEEICGGPNGLTVYQYGASSGGSTSTSTTTATGSTTSTSTTTSSTSTSTGAIGPLTTGLPSPWTYQGCWV